MAVAALGDGRLVAGDTTHDGTGGRRIGAQAMLPVLIGFMAPMVAIALIDPSALRSAKVLITAFLGTGFVVATGLFAISVFHPGQPVSFVVDRGRRIAAIVTAGPLTSSVEQVRFEEVAGLRMNTIYDRDGYAYVAAELMLRDGQRLLLPAGLSETDLMVMRTAIGLG